MFVASIILYYNFKATSNDNPKLLLASDNGDYDKSTRTLVLLFTSNCKLLVPLEINFSQIFSAT